MSRFVIPGNEKTIYKPWFRYGGQPETDGSAPGPSILAAAPAKMLLNGVSGQRADPVQALLDLDANV